MSTTDAPSRESEYPACAATSQQPAILEQPGSQSVPEASEHSGPENLNPGQSPSASFPSRTHSSNEASSLEDSKSKSMPRTQAKISKQARNGPMYRKSDAEGRLALTHRRPDFVLPELPADVHPKNSDFLDAESERKLCPQCKTSRSLFCHECLLVLTDRSRVPTVNLPFHIHILLHGEERRSAATSVHAALLSPGQVTIYPGNSFPRAFDPAVTAVLYPSETSVPVSELAMDRLEHVLLIDSKWKKAKTLIEDPLLRGLPHVRLEPVKTAFWRYHTKNVTDEGVSTIEAIYYLCKQRHKSAHDGDTSQCHCYDDLLFYFAHIYRRIRKTGTGVS